MSQDRRSLEGRVAVVTGGAQGLGRAYALRLARAGARVAIFDIAMEHANATAAEIVAGGAEGTAFAVDVSIAGEVERAFRDALGRFTAIDVLVNNAGGAFYSTTAFDEVSEEQWDRVTRVNLKGQWLCARALAPHMKQRRSGRVINIGSTVVTRGYPQGLAPYIAAKAGVVGLTRALAQELGPYGVTVNAVAPGYTPVATPKSVHPGEAAERLRLRMIDEQCIKRTETPEDLADVVAFLASEESRFITGQVINVDGGWAMN